MEFRLLTQTMELRSADRWTQVRALSSAQQTAETAGSLRLRLEHLFSPLFPLLMLTTEQLLVSVTQPFAQQTVEVPGAGNTPE
jgi:hypothetical protein